MTAPERLRALADWCERHGVIEDKDFVALGIGPYSIASAHVNCEVGSRLLSGRAGVKVDDHGWVTEEVEGQQIVFRLSPTSYPKIVDFPALEPAQTGSTT